MNHNYLLKRPTRCRGGQYACALDAVLWPSSSIGASSRRHAAMFLRYMHKHVADVQYICAYHHVSPGCSHRASIRRITPQTARLLSRCTAPSRAPCVRTGARCLYPTLELPGGRSLRFKVYEFIFEFLLCSGHSAFLADSYRVLMLPIPLKRFSSLLISPITAFLFPALLTLCRSARRKHRMTVQDSSAVDPHDCSS